MRENGNGKVTRTGGTVKGKERKEQKKGEANWRRKEREMEWRTRRWTENREKENLSKESETWKYVSL